MSSRSITSSGRGAKSAAGPIVLSLAAVALLGAMALSTRVVRIGSPEGTQRAAFSAAEYGKSEFPKVQAAIVDRAIDAATLASAIAKDPAAAAKQYGVGTGAGPQLCVKFTGVAGQQDSGVYDVHVDGMPETVAIHVQTGPAINGTDLRDATGTIEFGQFTNQIDYQNAGSALNKEMKREVLAKIDAAKLTGKTISVVGAFQLTDPANWVVTPVRLDVK